MNSSHPPELDVCFQPKEVGPCKAYQLRYYFDQSVGMCLSYQFGGCQGNENNFKEEKDCYMTCSEHMVEEPKEKSTSTLEELSLSNSYLFA